MFGKQKQPPIRTLIGEGTVSRASCASTTDCASTAKCSGDVVADGGGPRILVISEKARIIGRVSARTRDHQRRGRAARWSRDELLELQPKARITGDVRYELLEMHQGATIDGELRPLKAEDKPALVKLAASSWRI